MESLRLQFNTMRILPFFPLLQKGVHIPIEQPRSVKAVLNDTFGLTSTVIQNRIQTIFLNGNPVDDFEKTLLHEGDTLALSAAMPGLVGATMRAGGVLACFRSNISRREQTGEVTEHVGTFTLKLFNLLIRELGPWFLSRSVLIPASEFKIFLNGFSEEDWQACHTIMLNQQTVDPVQLSRMDWPEDKRMIELQVLFD